MAVPYEPVITREQWFAAQSPADLLVAMRDGAVLLDVSRPAGKRRIGQLAWASDRKLRLFACAGERRLHELMGMDSAKMAAAAELGEMLADGLISRDGLGVYSSYICNAVCAKTAADHVVSYMQDKSSLLPAFHDIMGDPFSAQQFAFRVGLRATSDVRPLVPFIKWENGLIVQTATHIYESRAFNELPVLADMLEDAGQITESELLRHLRAPGAHYKGCWALDCLLGKG